MWRTAWTRLFRPSCSEPPCRPWRARLYRMRTNRTGAAASATTVIAAETNLTDIDPSLPREARLSCPDQNSSIAKGVTREETKGLQRPTDTAAGRAEARTQRREEDAVKLRILIASVLTLAAVGFWPSPERASASRMAAPSDPAGLVVHEWGTFLAMNGSDGVSLDGMYHEEHALPSFVHARSKDQLRLPMSRMQGRDAGHLLLHAPGPARGGRSRIPDRPLDAVVPAGDDGRPGIVQAGSPPQTRDGHISWTSHVTPPAMKHNEPPATSSDALWNYARDVDAAYVTTQPGPGKRTTSGSGSSSIAASARRRCRSRCVSAADASPQRQPSADGVRASVHPARRERAGRVCLYAVAERRMPSSISQFRRWTTRCRSTQFVEQVSDDVARRLVESGLYEKEARAMVNTWASSYFKTDGVRAAVRAAAVVDRPLHPDAHQAGSRSSSSASWSAASSCSTRRARGAQRTAIRDLSSSDRGRPRAGVRDPAQPRAAMWSRSSAARCARPPTSRSGR